MRIRLATAADAEAIAKLADEFHDYLHRLGDKTDFHFTAATYLRDGFGDEPAFSGLVAESENTVVGFLLFHLGYDTDQSRQAAYVDDVYVQEAWRGQGVGKELMRSAAQAARSQGADVLWWGVYERNDSALRFYEKLGATYLNDLRFMAIKVADLIDDP